ncbi:MAG: NADH-quinone oxidoreductase subunit NuoG [Alphaproteobacteria bacterium]
MPKLTIDGTEIEVQAGTSVLQACEQLGIEVPRFCYHDRLSVPANCRMCLVEVKGAPKPVASCAMPCGDNMVVSTNSETVHKARKGVMEFLLINHPLDCPICDQGGECDLQDQAVSYGFDRGRYQENKRAVKEKELGPLVKTYMTRCIHCTRCIRFSDEIAGVSEMGALGRGEHVEIGTYIQKTVTSELSGNLVDVCPVGALTSKPYAFAARPWELRKTDSIDVLDAVGSNIRIDARGNEVLRILPRLHEEVNEEWLADKGRYACDGLKRQRLDQPYIRRDGRLQPASWDEALALVAEKLAKAKPEQVAAIAGDLCEAESLFALKELLHSLGVKNLECRQDGALYDVHHPVGYRCNTPIAAMEEADVVLLVGTNPRWEAPLLNARLRKASLNHGVKVASVGEVFSLNYPAEHLGNSVEILQQIVNGSHPFAAALLGAKKPLLLVGEGAFVRADGLALQNLLYQLAEKYLQRDGWNGYNFLHRAAARMAALTLGFSPIGGGLDLAAIKQLAAAGQLEFLYLLNADELDVGALKAGFTVYQGHHGDRGAAIADVILPGAAYTEKSGLYMNVEGRLQLTRQAVFTPGEAREDWKIVRALSALLGKTLPFDSHFALRQALGAAHPTIAVVDEVQYLPLTSFGVAGSVAHEPFALAIKNYYMSDVISRSSPTMAACTKELANGELAKLQEGNSHAA